MFKNSPQWIIILGVVVFGFLAVLMADAIGVTTVETHYLGDVVITSSSQEASIEQLITTNRDPGDLGVWKNAYTVETIDNAQILHYGFFSKNKNLPFTKR
jgi:hypothetical protein